ncbi:MAG: succinylglutamate desuccinylase/aspartoacylase family protein [Candidatus Heimdallarchaeota archaeon]|nr:succinylglutamate desuccinylase/aspartoacylase family protein [Candidatus Heimdallarchaeota archaeon]
MMEINVGENIGVPGEVVYGFWEAFEHPVGTIERLPVIIAQGMKDGPVVWLTANIHGDEYTGIPVIHSVINNLNLTKMAGAIVAIPTLNPAGSRTTSRMPYYDKKDPNRLFPDGNPFKEKQTPKEIVSEKTIVEKKGKVNEGGAEKFRKSIREKEKT